MDTQGGTTFSMVDQGQLVRCRKCREILIEPRPVASCDTSIAATMAIVQRGGCHLCAVGADHQHFYCARCGFDTMVRHPGESFELGEARSVSARRRTAAAIVLTILVLAVLAVPAAALLAAHR